MTEKEMTEESYFQDGEEATCISFAMGGPIYIPDMVGPLTTVSDFEKIVLQELQKLREEISYDSIDNGEEDDIGLLILVGFYSTHELRIINEEELVNKAFEEAFKENKETENHSETNLDKVSWIVKWSFAETVNETNLSKSITVKRKRRVASCSRRGLKQPYIEKVEELAKIKQQIDEDKATTSLHSFNANCRINDSTIFPEHMKKALKSVNTISKGKLSNTSNHVPISYPEVILCVKVFHYKKIWMEKQEFLVLGSQPLNQLRDKISCLTNEIVEKSGDHDTSGYFLIEDVFCNDRNPSSIDYSKPIFDWLKNSKEEALKKWDYILTGQLKEKFRKDSGIEPLRHLPRFRAADMHTTRFYDLQFRLGFGYLYCHRGDCKHIIVIRDMRLISPDDVQNRTDYPILTFKPKLRFQKCSICRIFRAEKVTVDDKWAPENPCYFCKSCYYTLHYVDGSLLYDEFSVFDYYQE
ncbi:snRNA-activating protein complex subunit [Impatiens glandulifera]|uniref:snRNA-activating protein complex subunit n=1 Tax=Impatiens glandulifera TaxID=253017 RepID=UPI001FB0C147|nr:snRNA-activating protein complex subunit [Impatiens glandulifera]